MKLIYIINEGKNVNNDFVYSFFFSNFDLKMEDYDLLYEPAFLNQNIDIDFTFAVKKKINTRIKLDLIQDSMCHSIKQAIDGIVAIAYESLDGYEEYPEDGRLVFHYGDSFSDVEELLAKKNILFE